MPELPEVETVKNIISPLVVNKTIKRVEVLRESIIKNTTVDEFISGLINETFLSVSRKGKFLIFHLTNKKVLLSHLRMEGKYYDVLENEENTKYARVIFHLDNGHKICYDDSRTFGLLKLSYEEQYLKEKEIAQLGPEPFQADPQKLMDACKKSTQPIKSTLLDQTLMTGLGNIYADEVLFAAKVHPLTSTNLLSFDQWEDIVSYSAIILNQAIKEGGSTIKSYHPGKGIDGNFQTSLKAYGKANTPCPNCGHIFRFIKVNGRGTTFCPNCQKRRGLPIKIAVFGKAGSGKSVVVNTFKKIGYPTISADEIVNELYKEKQIIKTINEKFNFHFEKEVNKEVLRRFLADNPKQIKQINSIIHPLVKKKIENFLNKTKGTIVVAEVPLLFEAKMEGMFDMLIAVDIEENKQNERLKIRDKEKASDIKKINSYSKFSQNKKKADLILDNNSNLNNLSKQILDLVNKLQDYRG